MNVPAIAERRYDARWAPQSAAEPEAGKLVFFMLVIFTIILFGRPTDLLRMRIPMALIAAALALLAYAFTKLAGRLPFVFTTEVKLLFALTIWFILGVPFAIWRGGAVHALTSTWFKTFIIFFLLSQTVSSISRVRLLLMTIVACEFFVTAFSVISYYVHGGSAEFDERFFGTTVGFVSGNYLGIAAAITFPYMILMLTRRPGILRALLLLSTMGLMVWMSVLTASRGGFLALGMCLLLCWVFLLGRARARWIGIVFLFGAVLAMTFAPPIFWERMSTMWKSSQELSSGMATSAAESTQVRENALRNSIRWTLENPIFGLGVGNFVVRSGERGGARAWIQTHNGYTQVSSEAGIPALLMFLALLLTSVKRMWAIGKLPADDPKANELAMWARATMISILGFMFGSCFAHLSYDYFVYYLVGIGIAIQVVYKRDFLETAPEPTPAKSRGAR